MRKPPCAPLLPPCAVCVPLLSPCAVFCARLDTSIALQVEKFHADAEERRKEKEAARIRREAAQAARCVEGVLVARAGRCCQCIQLGKKPGKQTIVPPLCCTCMRAGLHYGSHGLWHPAAPPCSHVVGPAITWDWSVTSWVPLLFALRAKASPLIVTACQSQQNQRLVTSIHLHCVCVSAGGCVRREKRLREMAAALAAGGSGTLDPSDPAAAAAAADSGEELAT